MLSIAIVLFSIAHWPGTSTLASLDRRDTGSVRFSVLDFGAVGDGKTDDSKAFLKAWAAVCGSNSRAPNLLAPGSRTYLVNPVTFKGPCKSSSISFQIAGDIIAPETPRAWTGLDSGQWLSFEEVNGLTVWERSTINGRGFLWWKQSCRYYPRKGCTSLAPTALMFKFCDDLSVINVNIVNSAQTHISLLGCNRVRLTGITIRSPGDSPNTDGIHLHACAHVVIDAIAIHAGDDCISIGDRVFNVNISRIFCGPGHGISVGSLGRGGSVVSVENISVKHAQFMNTTNGARIKTWQGGRGFARSISFEHINFTNVDNPIVIDQYYCDVPNQCHSQPTAVEISNVRYRNLWGTSSTPLAVSLNCSNVVGCSSLLLDTVNLGSNIPGGKLSSICINARGVTKGVVNPSVPCLK